MPRKRDAVDRKALMCVSIHACACTDVHKKHANACTPAHIRTHVFDTKCTLQGDLWHRFAEYMELARSKSLRRVVCLVAGA